MSEVLGIQNACGLAVKISFCYSVRTYATSFWSVAYRTLRDEGQVCSLIFNDKTLGRKTLLFSLNHKGPKVIIKSLDFRTVVSKTGF